MSTMKGMYTWPLRISSVFKRFNRHWNATPSVHSKSLTTFFSAFAPGPYVCSSEISRYHLEDLR